MRGRRGVGARFGRSTHGRAVSIRSLRSEWENEVTKLGDESVRVGEWEWYGREGLGPG